jgi:hypothetical protein
MARAFLCMKALCQFIRHEPIDPRIPAEYFDLENRWANKKSWSVELGQTTTITAYL